LSHLRKVWHLYHLMKSQWQPYEELRELQNRKLRVIIRHAYENVPFYRQKFDSAEVRPEDIKTVEDLPKLPITTKQDIKENFPDRIVAKDVDISKCWLPHTSGSTGIPLTVAYNEAAEDVQKAVALRPNLSCGQQPWDKWADITSPGRIHGKKWFQKLGIFNPVGISLFLEPKEQISALEKIKPGIIDGYSSSIYLLAKALRESGSDKIHPKIIYGTAELLTNEMREYINSTFGVEMYDQFGCVELGRTAWECPAHSGYHIDMEAVVMEFIRDGKQVPAGERGEIVYTSLYNYAMPLIRYAIGDIGVPSDKVCPCGRGLPLMERVEGRVDAFVQVPGGRIFSQMTFWAIMRTLSERNKIEQFRVIQETIGKLKIQVVPGRGFGQDTINHIMRDIRHVLGSEIFIEIGPVDVIPSDNSGKVRSVVSKIEIDWSQTTGRE